ncbi:hypothetical protein [Streptomyces sp. NPDC002088]|uniref:hypothetical protein n=1 Tax=Streptomyces sp. NPDC002088 TaxID=3154665 RepID=UPI0033243087
MAVTVLVDVRCRGCRRLLGVSKKDAPIFCDEMCANDFPAASTEARDALVEAVYYKGRHTYDILGKMFGFSRQRAAQIVTGRDLRRVS